MKDLRIKTSIVLASLLLSTSTFAATALSTMNATATITPGCVFELPSYSAWLGTIKTGQVGEGALSITVVCTNNMAYTIFAGSNSVTYQGTEPVVITLWKNDNNTIPLTTDSGIQASMAAGVNTKTHVIGVRANGAAGRPDLGKGPILSSPQTFNASIPIMVTF